MWRTQESANKNYVKISVPRDVTNTCVIFIFFKLFAFSLSKNYLHNLLQRVDWNQKGFGRKFNKPTLCLACFLSENSISCVLYHWCYIILYIRKLTSNSMTRYLLVFPHVPSKRNIHKASSSLKIVVFWDVARCITRLNRRFGGTYRLHLQGGIIRKRWTRVSSWLQSADMFTRVIHSASSQKTTFFIVNAVKASNRTSSSLFES
jgi:hypothetical protein